MAEYDGRQFVGIDLHRRRSVIVRMTPEGQQLGTVRVDNDPFELAWQVASWGESPELVLEATYGWYWAADALVGAGAHVHLAHPLGVKGHRSYSTAARHDATGQIGARTKLSFEANDDTHARQRVRHVVISPGRATTCSACSRVSGRSSTAAPGSRVGDPWPPEAIPGCRAGSPALLEAILVRGTAFTCSFSTDACGIRQREPGRCDPAPLLISTGGAT